MTSRIRFASVAAGWHFLISVLLGLVVTCAVVFVWYPYPYSAMSGGHGLLLLLVGVDVVCGPMLTFLLFAPSKSRRELKLDFSIIVLIQLAALLYGLHTVFEVRPLYLVSEFDRFKVIARPHVYPENFSALPPGLNVGVHQGPKVVGLRDPIDLAEKQKVLFESLEGGRDYAERPDFYLPYEGEVALKSLRRAKPLAPFVQKYPDQAAPAQKVAVASGIPIDKLVYLPVIARQDWIAVLDDKAMIIGFLKGDGF